MFRTLNNRGRVRSKDLQFFGGNKNGKLVLSSKQIKLIEDTNLISLAEKIELLLVASGNKLTTELYMNVSYVWDEKKQLEIPDLDFFNKIKLLLDKLPFQYFEDTSPMKNRQSGNLQQFVWFQVSINEAISHFMQKYPDDLTEFEEGVIYGFPLSAIRAFNGLIEPSHTKNTPAADYLAGVCSKDFWQDEQDYYQLWWERLRKLSPKIVKEAEDKYNLEYNSK